MVVGHVGVAVVDFTASVELVGVFVVVSVVAGDGDVIECAPSIFGVIGRTLTTMVCAGFDAVDGLSGGVRITVHPLSSMMNRSTKMPATFLIASSLSPCGNRMMQLSN